jgi:MSHA biogenesis protein MshG
MPRQYKYRAITSEGQEDRGIVAADNEAQVLEFLFGQNLTPIEIKNRERRSAGLIIGRYKKVDYESLIIFTNHLSTMTSAGIPILKALSLIKVGAPDGAYNKAIRQIRLSMQSGKLLSQAMSEFEPLFTRVYISCIAAGEESGRLDNILSELSETLEKEMELIRQIKSGIRYPIIVLSVISIAVAVIMWYVIPKFMDFYGAFGATLPLPTRILIGISSFFTDYWYVIVGGVMALLLGWRNIVGRPEGRLWLDKQYLKLPVLGDLIIKGNVARFSLMFGILLRAGLPITKSLDILIQSVNNSQIGREIGILAATFHEGREIRPTDAEFEYFPEAALQMIAIGLESGSLDRMLAESGKHYSKEVEYTSRHLTALLEPIMTLVLGGMALVLALAILLPMWNLIKVFGGP